MGWLGAEGAAEEGQTIVKRLYRFELYRDRKREWRWRLRAVNGRVLADSGEGYRSRFSARRAISALRFGVQHAEVHTVASKRAQ